MLMKKNIFKSLAYVAVLSAPLFIASCDEFGTDDNPAGAYISMDTSDVSLELGKKHEAKSTYQRTGIVASDAFIEYSSSDEKIATVDAASGLVTAVGGGTCDIIAKPYFVKNGGKLYTKEELKYSVTVTDYRARVGFAKTEATVNSADIVDEEYKFAKAEIVYPTTATVTYTPAPAEGAADDTNPVKSISEDGVITLKDGKKDGVCVVTAKLASVPAGYETDTFGDNAKFTLTVKQGIAYISGYDADDKPIRKTMFLKGEDNKNQYITIDNTWSPSGDVTLDAGIYYVTATGDFDHNIKIKGDATFILANGSNFQPTKAIIDDTPDAHTINIYGQKKQTGKLTATGAGTGDVIIDFKAINIYGGKVNVSTKVNGSGAFNKIGAINVFKGGELTATHTDGEPGYGIKMKSGGAVTADGGIVKVNGSGSNADYSYALIGDVVVKNKGKFTASSKGYRAMNGTVTATTAKASDNTTWVWDDTKKTFDGNWEAFTGTSSKKFVWAE